MGLFDFLKGSKDVSEKCMELAQKENYSKLIKLAYDSKTYDERIAALNAIATLRPDPDAIKCAMDSLKSDNADIRLAAAKAMAKIGTKPQYEPLLHFAESDDNEEVKKALTAAAVEAKERTPRW